MPSFGVPGSKASEFCSKHVRAGMVDTRRGRTPSSGGGAAGSRRGQPIGVAAVGGANGTRKRRADDPSTMVVGSSSDGTGEGSKKRPRRTSAVPSMAVPVRPEEAERTANDAEGCPSQPSRWRQIQLRPTPAIETQPEGWPAVKTEIKVSNQPDRTRGS